MEEEPKHEDPGQIGMCILIAKGILHTRRLRRKFGLQLLAVIMVLFSLGVFFIGDWIDSDKWLFAIYWGTVIILTLFLMFLALYDAMRAMVEVKEEHNKEMAQDLRNLAKLLKEAEKEKQSEDDAS